MKKCNYIQKKVKKKKNNNEIHENKFKSDVGEKLEIIFIPHVYARLSLTENPDNKKAPRENQFITQMVIVLKPLA